MALPAVGSFGVDIRFVKVRFATLFFVAGERLKVTCWEVALSLALLYYEGD